MNNNNCGCTPRPRVEVPIPNYKYQIHQMEKISDNGEKYDIYPNTLVQAVHDIYTGETLSELLQKSNHIALSFNTDFETTVKQVPTSQRRKGLIITFTNCGGKIKHYEYTGCNTEFINFANRSNWVEFPRLTDEDRQRIKDEEIYYKPVGLSYNPHTSSLDYTYSDKNNVNHSLSTPLNIQDTWYKIESVVLDKNTIKITQKSSNGSLSEFCIPLPTISAKGKVIKKITQGGMCGLNSNTTTEEVIVEEGKDTYVTNVKIVGNNLIIERNDSTEFGVELPINTLPNPIPNPIPNNVPTREEFDTLKEIVEELPECNCEELKEIIKGLTRRVEALENKQPPVFIDNNKYVTRGEWMSDEVIRLHFTDGTYIDIAKPIPEPPKPINLIISASNLEGVGEANPVFNVRGTEGNDTITEPISLEVDGKPYTPNTPIRKTQSTTIRVKATYKDKVVEEVFNVRVTPTPPPPTPNTNPKYKIKYGFKKYEEGNEVPTVDNLTHTMEVESIENGVIIPIPAIINEHGRYVYAIEKPLTQAGYYAYLPFNGGYELATEQETIKSDVEIEGKQYTLYVDYLTNREFKSPLNIKVSSVPL